MGKTIQTIAMLLEEPRRKPNLVVAPTVRTSSPLSRPYFELSL
jgi:SNF2 family DNA or RNA helicase